MNEKLLKEMERAREFVIVVEGKKDKTALQQLGFSRIFVINEIGKSFPEKIEELMKICDKKDKVCILTDFDKKGKKIYLLLKSKFCEIGIRMDNTLRGWLLKEHISHIEGLSSFMKHNHDEKRENKKYR